MAQFRPMAFLECAGLHTRPVTDLKFSYSGDYLATVSKDKTTKVSALKPDGSLKLVHTVPSSSVPAKMVWHPTSVVSFAVCGEDKNVDIWDVRATRATARIPALGNHINLSWSPDGKSIAVGNNSDKLVVLDVDTGTCSQPMSFSYEINEMSWSGNSDNLLVSTGCIGGEMGGVNVVSYASKELKVLHHLPAHNSNCHSLSIDSGFGNMAVGSADFLVSVWGLRNLTCRYTIPYSSQPRSLTFSGDSEWFTAATESPAVEIYNTKSGRKALSLKCPSPTKLVTFHPKQKLLAMTSEAGENDKPKLMKHVRLVNVEKQLE